MLKLKLPKLVYPILAFLIVIGLIGIYLQYRERQKTRAHATASAAATIEKVEVVRAVDPVTGGERTAYIVVGYSFSMNDNFYSRSTNMDSAAGAQFVPWKTGIVCYDPESADPLISAELYPPGFRCGK